MNIMNQTNFYVGLLLITCSTLIVQITQTRILSYVTWYHLSFFVISMAMFGITAGAVFVYLEKEKFKEEHTFYNIFKYAAFFSISCALSLLFQLTLFLSDEPGFIQSLVWVLLALTIAVPFFYSGIVVSLALTRSPFPIGRVYAVDMIGASLGCFLVIALIDLTDGISAILWASFLGGIGAIAFSSAYRSEAWTTGDALHKCRKPMIIWVIAIGSVALANSLNPSVFGLHPVAVKGKIVGDSKNWYEDWNSFSRVEAELPMNRPPHMWGPSPRLDLENISIQQSYLEIDADAGTTAYGVYGDLSKLGFLKADVVNLAYFIPGLESAAVIGVGGGRDLLAARLFGVKNVIGVEVNPVFRRLLDEEEDFSEFVGLKSVGGVTIEVDEARSWFARTTNTFDIIQMSLIDTWAATGAGAFTLSENGLYTVEAWQIFLDRLNPNGVYTVSRWYSENYPPEAGRLVSLGRAALKKIGVEDPDRNLFIASSGNIVSVIISRKAFSPEVLERLHSVTEDLDYQVLWSPQKESDRTFFKVFMDAKNSNEIKKISDDFLIDLNPPTDDRPFFFNQVNFKHIITIFRNGPSQGVIFGNIQAILTLIKLLLISLCFVIVAIIFPLRGALNQATKRLVIGGTGYFFLIGMGFMFFEIGMLQRFSIFLGHPTYSLSIVLASLILSVGIGSLISDYIPKNNPFVQICWVFCVASYILVQAVFLPPTLLSFDGAGLMARAAISIAVILPAGLLMGFAFPLGLQLVESKQSLITPWLWGINGASGVLGSVIAIGLSLTFGITWLLLLAAVCYLGLIPFLFAITSSDDTGGKIRSPLVV